MTIIDIASDTTTFQTICQQDRILLLRVTNQQRWKATEVKIIDFPFQQLQISHKMVLIPAAFLTKYYDNAYILTINLNRLPSNIWMNGQTEKYADRQINSRTLNSQLHFKHHIRTSTMDKWSTTAKNKTGRPVCLSFFRCNNVRTTADVVLIKISYA